MREPEQSGGWVERRRVERYEQGDTYLPIVGAALCRYGKPTAMRSAVGAFGAITKDGAAFPFRADLDSGKIQL